MMKIPVIINNCNLLEWPRQMVEDAKTFDNVGDIIIVDNNSTYEPLLEWYKTSPCEVVMCNKNHGQSGAWFENIPQNRGYEYYVVSDTDLGISDVPKDCLNVLRDKMEKYPQYDRIGLSLISIVERTPDTPLYNWIGHALPHYWDMNSLEDGLLKRHIIDTTFGMYYKDRNKSGTSCATYKPYTARHLPWEILTEDIDNLKERNYEFYYYLKNAAFCCSFKRYIEFDRRHPSS